MRRTGYTTGIKGVALLCLTVLTGCTVSPATGERIFTGFMSPAQEQQIGFSEHPKILKQFGGAYEDAAVAQYVDRIGQALARRSELPNQKFTFTVLNSDQVNAFAVPGGFIYVTRGLLALADTEAELAGVIAHEIGHITGRHTAQRYAQAQFGGLATVGLGVLFGSTAAELAGNVLPLHLQSFSRDQEFEADLLGVRYIVRDEYEPEGMASFLSKLRSHSQLQLKLAGENPAKADQTNMLASHPRAVDRVKRAIAQAQNASVAKPRSGRVNHMQMLHGLLFGDDPKEGFVRGRDFIHPGLRFRFSVPEGFRLQNSASAVIARNKEGAIIQFDGGGSDYRGRMTNYISQVWAKKTDISRTEGLTINEMEGATAVANIQTRGGPRNVRLVAVRHPSNRILRFVFLTPNNLTQRLSVPLRRTTFSLKALSAGEAAAFKPLRIRIRAVRGGETVASLSREMAVHEAPSDWFRVLNGLGPNQEPRTGQLIKLVKE